MVRKLLYYVADKKKDFGGLVGNLLGYGSHTEEVMTNKSTNRTTGVIFWFPVIGIIISVVLLALGHYLRLNAAYAAGMQGDLISFYIVFGKFSYFYSGVFFLISIAGFIRHSTRKKRPFIEGRKSLSDLRELSWGEFREYVMGLFQKLGYSPEGNAALNDEHAELRLKRAARTSLVCCKKYYVRKIPLSMVFEFYTAMLRASSLEKGYFITTGSFSQEARKFASDKPLVLIDGERLMDFARIAESIDAAKVWSSMQNNPAKTGFTCPICGAQMVLRTCESGAHTVAQLWICSSFPACKGTLRKEQEDLMPIG